MSDEQAIASTTNASTSTAVIEFSEFELGVNEMQRQLKDVHFDLTIPKDDKLARQARAKLVTSRRAIEERRLELNRKDRALVQGRIDARDEFCKKLSGLVAELEDPLDSAIRADEQRRAEEKAEAERAEQKRLGGIQGLIDSIRDLPVIASTATLLQIQEIVQRLTSHDISEAEYQELTPIAALAKDQSLTKLRQLHDAAIRRETDARRAAEQQAELARLQEAERKRQAEAAEAARIEAARITEANRLEQQRLSAERAELARQQAEALEQRRREDAEAKERRLREDREALERQQKVEKAQRERAEHHQMLLSEIQGIQQQVIIAEAGRIGVRKGNTLECLQDTLAETEAWKIEDDYFGDLADVARMTKDAAVGSIKKKLVEWKERVAAETAAARQADEARQVEVQRIEHDRKLYGAAKDMLALLVILSSPDSMPPATIAKAKKMAQELIRKIGETKQAKA